MKLLMLVPASRLPVGPVPKLTPILVAELRRQGHTVTVSPWGRRRDDETRTEKLRQRARDLAGAVRLLRRRQYDALIVSTAHDPPAVTRDLPLLLAARLLARTVILHWHGTEPHKLAGHGGRRYRAATRLLLRLADAALVLSTEERAAWSRLFPEACFAVVRNPFVPEHSGPVTPWQPPAPSEPVLLFAGRLIAEKGIFDLLRALPLVRARIPCHLLVAGVGAQQEEAQALAAELGIGRHVTFAGYLRGADLAAAYAAAAALVLPTYWGEGFPQVILEAMHAGLPIVTTRIRGAADHLVEGDHAVFVPARDPQALAARLAVLLADAPLRARMAAAVRAKVAGFAPEPVAREYAQVVRAIIERG